MMWLGDYHVDGLRYDMTLYIRSIDGNPQSEIPEGWGLTQWINRDIHVAYPHAITIAEDLQDNPYLTKSDIEGGAGFSTQWDAAFVHPIRDVITQPDDAGRDMQKVVDAITHRYNGDAFQRVIYTESHDEVANGKSARAERDQRIESRRLVCEKEVNAGNRNRFNLARHPDAIPRAGIVAGRLVPRH